MAKLISFVIPAKNEEDSVSILASKIDNVLKKLRRKYEILFIDDGSTDNTLKELKKIQKKNKNVKIVSFRGNWGKSLALEAGFLKAKGDIVVTMDADLQDEPNEIPRFIKQIEAGNDLVSGWKKIRHDPFHKVIPSRILNFLIRKLTGVPIHDTNCGYKAYKRTVIESLNLYGEQYRFIPILASKQNFKVTEIIVKHNARKFGKSKFGIERNIKGFLDLITIFFLTGYLRRPGHFFGGLGIFSFAIGFVVESYIAFLRLTTGSIQYHYPLLFLGMLLIIVGIQFLITGLLGELITSYNQKKESVQKIIREEII